MALQDPSTAITADISEITDGESIDASDVTVPLVSLLAAVRAGYVKAASGSTQIGQLDDVLLVTAPVTKTTATNTVTLDVDDMTAATSGAAGTAGLVPQPAAGDQTKFLRGDATWGVASSAGMPCRLSLSSTLPVTTSDTTSTTVYLHPYKGYEVWVRDDDEIGSGNAGWGIYDLSAGLSASVPVPGSNTMYDILLHKDAGTGTVSLSFLAWASSVARDGSLTFPYRRGLMVAEDPPSNATLGIVLGTAYVNTSGQIIDAVKTRYLWNNYNRVPRTLFASETDVTTASYSTQAWRPWNNDNTNAVDFCVGVLEDIVSFDVMGLPTGNFGRIGIGVNSTSVNGATLAGGSNGQLCPAKYVSLPARIGQNTLRLLEYADAGGSSVTFNYDKDDGKQELGGTGFVWA